MKTQTLVIKDPPGSTVNITTTPGERLDLSYDTADVIVNLHVKGTLGLTIGGLWDAGALHTDGGTIRFIGHSFWETNTADEAVLNNNLTGDGTISFAGRTSMEINGRVGGGLTFDFQAQGIPVESLKVDQPKQFHATINVPQGSGMNLDLVGLHVTQADIRGDILSMYDGHKLVDTLRVTGGDGGGIHHLSISQTSMGVVLGYAPQPSGNIPLHIGS